MTNQALRDKESYSSVAETIPFPSFSLLMCVHCLDNPVYLDEALESIKKQSIPPQELVIVFDGQVPRAIEDVVERFSKYFNCVIVRLANNVGLGSALNEGLVYCSHSYVARFDADDICLESRFEMQLRALQSDPNIDVLGAQVDEYEEDLSTKISSRRVPLLHDQISQMAKIRNPVSHPVVMFKKESVMSVGGYPAFRKAQDYALWSLMIKKGYKFANLPNTLLKMRSGSSMMSRRDLKYFQCELDVIKYQKSIGFISFPVFIRNSTYRFLIRSMPKTVRSLLYKLIRKFPMIH